MAHKNITLRLGVAYCLMGVSSIFLAHSSAIAESPGQATQATYEQSTLLAPEHEKKVPELRLDFGEGKNVKTAELPLNHALSGERSKKQSTSPVTQTLGSLLFVTALFACFAYWLRRNRGHRNANISAEAWEILGRGSLSPKHEFQLVRLGNRVLLLGYSSQSVHTLTEIEDPDEVNHLRSICKTQKPQPRGRVSEKLLKVLSGRSTKEIDSFDHDSSPAYVGSRDV